MIKRVIMKSRWRSVEGIEASDLCDPHDVSPFEEVSELITPLSLSLVSPVPPISIDAAFPLRPFFFPSLGAFRTCWHCSPGIDSQSVTLSPELGRPRPPMANFLVGGSKHTLPSTGPPTFRRSWYLV